ncbi:hypothetical protein N7493_009111 [Penicillium malachiteum]|uniref:Uncharacterized protein n=1 Tax=Penicillium malachiteum TaxID=1324776 RepID=A0AAD6HFV8_9EURO|nr:hypothetical protein N7493_009111 [Penicillium malachiteum]
MGEVVVKSSKNVSEIFVNITQLRYSDQNLHSETLDSCHVAKASSCADRRNALSVTSTACFRSTVNPSKVDEISSLSGKIMDLVKFILKPVLSILELLDSVSHISGTAFNVRVGDFSVPFSNHHGIELGDQFLLSFLKLLHSFMSGGFRDVEKETFVSIVHVEESAHVFVNRYQDHDQGPERRWV